MTPFVIIPAGVALALLLPVFVHPLLVRLGMIDVPNERSSHSTPTIRGMGVAIAVAGCSTVAFLAGLQGEGYEALLAITLLGVGASLLGFAEDWRGVPVLQRAGLQVLIGVGFGLYVATVSGSWVWIPVTALAVSGYMNVANFMDGIDGISGLHGAVCGGYFAVLGLLTDTTWMTQAGLVSGGVFLAFLPWNLSARRVFLGDVGSYFLGAWVAGLCVLTLSAGMNPLLVLGPIMIYLTDTGYTLFRRIQQRKRWYEAHRSHVYQRLTIGTRKHWAVAVMVACFSIISASFSLVALVDSWIASAASFILVLAVAALYVNLPSIDNKIDQLRSGAPA